MNNTLILIQSHFFTPDRLPIAVMAMGATAAIGFIAGPLGGNATPFYWGLINAVFGGFGRKLDRRQRKVADLIFRGFFLTLCVLAISAALGEGARRLVMHHAFSGASEIAILSLLLTSGSVWFALSRLLTALKDKKTVKGAFYTISRSTRIDLSASDDYGITRAGMALAARSFDKGVVAPLLWYLIGGLPAAFIYAGLAELAWRFGKDGFGKGFGTIPLALEKLMGLAPSALAGFLIALAGLFTPTGGMTRALRGLLSQRHAAPYAEGGAPVTAMAYALNVGLGGPAIDLEGSALQRIWAGPEGATAQLDGGHLRRALYIVIMAHLLLAVALGGWSVAMRY